MAKTALLVGYQETISEKLKSRQGWKGCNICMFLFAYETNQFQTKNMAGQWKRRGKECEDRTRELQKSKHIR